MKGRIYIVCLSAVIAGAWGTSATRAQAPARLDLRDKATIQIDRGPKSLSQPAASLEMRLNYQPPHLMAGTAGPGLHLAAATLPPLDAERAKMLRNAVLVLVVGLVLALGCALIALNSDKRVCVPVDLSIPAAAAPGARDCVADSQPSDKFAPALAEPLSVPTDFDQAQPIATSSLTPAQATEPAATRSAPPVQGAKRITTPVFVASPLPTHTPERMMQTGQHAVRAGDDEPDGTTAARLLEGSPDAKNSPASSPDVHAKAPAVPVEELATENSARRTAVSMDPQAEAPVAPIAEPLSIAAAASSQAALVASPPPSQAVLETNSGSTEVSLTRAAPAGTALEASQISGSRLGGLRTLKTSLGIKNLHREAEYRKATLETIAMPERLSERAVLAQPDSPPQLTHARVQTLSGEVKAAPEIIPPPQGDTEREIERHRTVKPPRVSRLEPGEDIETLPSWRGQYRKRR